MKLNFKIEYIPVSRKSTIDIVSRNDRIIEDLDKLVQYRDYLINHSVHASEVMQKANRPATDAIVCLGHLYNFDSKKFIRDNTEGNVSGAMPMSIVNNGTAYVANPVTWIYYIKALKHTVERRHAVQQPIAR